MNLFTKQNITLHSGKQSDFKIECDALTDEDWECLAYLVSKKIQFKAVFGVPKGGVKLADKLQQYATRDYLLPILICDDVLTTGNSMEKFRIEKGESNVMGVVIFARGQCPSWITPIFKMTEL